ncbi:MAG: hypothetical protein E7355_05075 [Clostridiales bacterium]|nr:hypothetical protein [Clostridiales bacterium]
MKRKKVTAIATMLAAMAAISVAGGLTVSNEVRASADAAPYSVSKDAVFSVNDKDDIIAETVTVGEETRNVLAAKLGDEKSVWLRRDLAYSWYEKDKDGNVKAQNFSLTFAFKDLTFKSVTIKMQSNSAWATEDGRTTNKITVKPTDGGINVAINDGAEEKIAYTAGEKITLELIESDEDGKYAVKFNTKKIGDFTNIGGRYAEYVSIDKNPLSFIADFGDAKTDALTGDEKTTIVLYQLNGQEFYLNNDSKIEDTKAPAFVVNEDIEAFLLGSAFSLDYKVIDVLHEDGDSSISSVDVQYYQYNPMDTVEEGKDEFDTLKDNAKLANFTSHTFFHTVYTKEGVTSSVFEQLESEYVAIRFLVGDKTHSGKTDGKPKMVYDLAWYVDSATKIDASIVKDTGFRTSDEKILYIPIDKNNAGPTYKILATENEENKKEANYDKAVEDYNASLSKAAENVYAGSNSYLNLPSLKWLFADNNSYNGLKMTISYKSETSTSPSTTSVTPSTAKIPVSKEGVYEFKIFAADSAGNPMKYYLDGELVDVTSNNVWDIKEIPYFTFTIKNRGIKMDPSLDETTTGRKDTRIKDATYTLSDMKVVGATNLKEAYALYKVHNFDAYNSKVLDQYKIKRADLHLVTYQSIASNLDFSKVENGNYFDVYLDTYVTLLAKLKGKTLNAEEKELLKGAFERIGEAGDRVNGAEKYDVYEWSSSSQSFKAVEEGEYIIFADYWEGLMPQYNHAAAYKVIIVESEKATIAGESDWLKNNITSVVLFSVAGVLLIVIVILLMVKPSSESLEDVEAKAAKKQERVLAKKKKNDDKDAE